MERFSNDQKPAAPASGANQGAGAAHKAAHHAEKMMKKPGWSSKLLVVVVVLAALVVAVALAVGLYEGINGDRFVKDDQYQAVFLDNGQVYFGKLSSTNKSYVRLTDIYYLQVEQQVQPEQVAEGEEAPAQPDQPQISLAKLGNELHGPEDEMFISRDKIVFWENLKTEGQVTTAITEFVNSQ